MDLSRFRQPGTLRSMEVGDLRVSYVPDGTSRIRARALFPEVSEEAWAQQGRHLDDQGCLTVSAGGLLIERGERAMLIDAGLGPLSSAPPELDHPSVAAMYGGALLESLHKLGRRPEDVEAIAITHLHVEHVGWAAHPEPGASGPAFTRADVLLSQAEWDHRQPGYGVSEAMLATIGSRLRIVGDGQEVFPGVRAVAVPEHTLGQMAYSLSSGEHRLLAFADVMHSPVQVEHPQWAVIGDPAPDLAQESRRQVLQELADTATIGFGVHFADVGFGTVRRTGTGFAWQPLP